METKLSFLLIIGIRIWSFVSHSNWIQIQIWTKSSQFQFEWEPLNSNSSGKWKMKLLTRVVITRRKRNFEFEYCNNKSDWIVSTSRKQKIYLMKKLIALMHGLPQQTEAKRNSEPQVIQLLFLRLVTEYLRLTLVFVRNSALREKFYCYFLGLFC